MSKKKRGAGLRVRGTAVGLCDLFAPDRCVLFIQYPRFNQCEHMKDRLLKKLSGVPHGKGNQDSYERFR